VGYLGYIKAIDPLVGTHSYKGLQLNVKYLYTIQYNMRTSIILALVAGLVPAISALPSKRFEDHVSLGFYNSNPKKTFQSVHDIKPAGANKNVAGTFLMYIGDAKEFTWSEDGSSKKHVSGMDL
jgi:hypothetical protein